MWYAKVVVGLPVEGPFDYIVPESLSKKIKIGVIGVGHLGEAHAYIYKEMPEVELVGVVDINPQRAREIGVRLNTDSYDDYHKLLGKVEAVSIAVPTDSHFSIARDFLENNIHTLIEKPVTKTVGEAEELLNISKKKGLILQVGHVERFNAAVIAMEKLVTSPRFIEVHRLSPYQSRGIEVGVVLDLMIHDLDIILQLVSSPVSKIEALGVNILTPFEDIANVRLSFSDGAIANITASRVSEEKMRKIRIFQDDAYISLDYIEQKFSVYRKKENKIVKEEVVLQKTEPLKEELKDFVRCVRGGRRPRVPGEEAKEVLELALEITHQIQSLRN
jgi:predicted dehydrogenase